MSENQNGVSRRSFVQTAALAGMAADLARASAPAADVKIGLYSITYGGVWYRGDALTTEQVIDRAAKFGYHGVEIDGKRPHGNPLDLPKARCQDLRKRAADQGLEIYAVAANNDFSSPIPEHRESQLLYTRELMRMTSELGAKVLRVFAAWPGVTLRPEGGGRYDIAQTVWKAEHQDFTAEQTWAWCRQGLEEAARMAGDFGIVLALQNHPPVINKGYVDSMRIGKRSRFAASEDVLRRAPGTHFGRSRGAQSLERNRRIANPVALRRRVRPRFERHHRKRRREGAS